MATIFFVSKAPKRQRKTSTLYRRLSENISELRRRKKPKITQRALEEATGCYQGQLSHVERGIRGISIEKVEAIAEVLGVDPSTLFQPHREQREQIRSLFEDLPPEQVIALRGNPEYAKLLMQLRGVVRYKLTGNSGNGAPS